MANVTTSHYKIYDYWKDKAITPKGEVITTRDSHSLDDEYVVDDAYVPRCWGCGKAAVRDGHLDEWITKTCGDGDEGTQLKRLWNCKETRRLLNRCHIVPGALGGEDKPANLFLMCESCRIESPDTVYPSEFFKWVVSCRKRMLFGRLHPNYIFEKVDESLKQDYGVTLIELLEKIHILGGDDKLTDMTGFLMNRIGTHGAKVSDSTQIVATTKWLISIYVDLLLEQ